MAKKKLTLLMAILAISSNVYAGVVVEQGGASNSFELRSPMILSGPFPLVDPATWSETDGIFGKVKYTDPAIYENFYNYFCDGIALKELIFGGEPDGDKLIVYVRGLLDGKKTPHDRKYNLELELLNGDQPIFATPQVFKVKEGGEKSFEFKFRLAKSVLQNNPDTTIKATITTLDY